MVFDNCQIDVFFHMRSHYNRLRNVRSVVDCSPPKEFKRFSHRETSCQYALITNPPTNAIGMKRQNCFRGRCPCNIQKWPAENHYLRPSTRRHSKDTPSKSETNTESHRESSADSSHSKRSSLKRTNHDSIIEKNGEKHDNSGIYAVGHDVIIRHKVVIKNPNTDAKNVVEDIEELDLNQNDNKDSNESVKYNTPVTSAEENDPISAQDHEYLQFLLRITEDIIKNDLYTNREMKRAFISHINANKERLSLDRMLLHIYELMRELSVSFSDDSADSIPSWTNIEAAMKDLIGVNEKITREVAPSPKSIEAKYKTTPDTERNCVCTHLKSLDQCFPMKKEIIDDFQSQLDESYDTVDKFQFSLERLTERTEPMTSQATCKASTTTACSSFGDVQELPGFENLETPTCTKNLTKKKRPSNSKKLANIEGVKKNSLSNGHNRKISKSKPPKSTRQSKEIRRISEASTEDSKIGTSDIEMPEYRKLSITKPILINLQGKETTEDSTVLNISDSGRNYVLVPGLIYIFKEFLDENPNALMTIKIPSLPISSHPQTQTHAPDALTEVSEDSVAGKIKDLFENIPVISKENIDDDKKQVVEEVDKKKVHILGEPYNNNSNNEEFNMPYDNDLDDEESNTYNNDLDPEESVAAFANDPDNEEFNTPNVFPADFPNEPPFYLTQSELLESNNNAETPHPEDFDRNLLTNEYDLTPQKENDHEPTMKALMSEDYVIKNDNDQTSHFLMIKEIDPSSVNQQRNSTKNLGVLSEDFPSQKVSRTSNSDKDDTSAEDEEELNSPLNFSAEEIRETNSNEQDLNSSELKHAAAEDNIWNIDKINSEESVFSKNQTENTSDLLSVATIERTNQILDEIIDEKIPVERALPLYQEIKFRNDHLIGSEDDSEVKEVAHQRKVSILKNPINQVPIEKILGEIDETKKRGESIKKAVENLKDRQTNRDHFMTRAIQDLESSRLSEKAVGVSNETPSSIPTPPPIIHSSLKAHPKNSKSEDHSRNARLSRTDEISTSKITDGVSSNEMVSNIQSLSKQIGSIESVITDASSEFLPELDGKPSEKLLINQRKGIMFNNPKGTNQTSDVKRDDELTVMLDQLVDAFKKQQELEDEIKRDDEERKVEETVETENKKGFTCCGLCKTKKPPQVKTFREAGVSYQPALSEQTYKAKSEAFEWALANLGHKSTTQQESSTEMNEPTKTKNPSPILHSGNRLSLVRIADQRNSDYNLEHSESDTTSEKEKSGNRK